MAGSALVIVHRRRRFSSPCLAGGSPRVTSPSPEPGRLGSGTPGRSCSPGRPSARAGSPTGRVRRAGGGRREPGRSGRPAASARRVRAPASERAPASGPAQVSAWARASGRRQELRRRRGRPAAPRGAGRLGALGVRRQPEALLQLVAALVDLVGVLPPGALVDELLGLVESLLGLLGVALDEVLGLLDPVAHCVCLHGPTCSGTTARGWTAIPDMATTPPRARRYASGTLLMCLRPSPLPRPTSPSSPWRTSSSSSSWPRSSTRCRRSCARWSRAARARTMG